MWALFARDYPRKAWLAIVLGAMTGIDAGLWLLLRPCSGTSVPPACCMGSWRPGTCAHLRTGERGWLGPGGVPGREAGVRALARRAAALGERCRGGRCPSLRGARRGAGVARVPEPRGASRYNFAPRCLHFGELMSFAFVFPGPGLAVGRHARRLAAAEPGVRATFDEASGVLGLRPVGAGEQGPAEGLNATEYTQPAMLAAGVATWRLWRARGGALPDDRQRPQPGGIHRAGVRAVPLEFAAAVDLVRFRGQVMQEAVPAGTGAMAAILGLEDEAGRGLLCARPRAGEVVEAVNFNSPGQVVIAGQSRGRGARASRRQGARCQARGGAAGERALALQPDARGRRAPGGAPGDARGARARHPLRQRGGCARARGPRRHPRRCWCGSWRARCAGRTRVRALAADGHAQVIECGPGKVLTGLNRRIERRPDLAYLALEDPALACDGRRSQRYAEEASTHV